METIYGRTSAGQACKTCQKVGGYCSKHSDQKPVAISKGSDHVAVKEYRERVESKLRGEQVAPVSEIMQLLGAVREIQFSINGITKSQQELETELRQSQARIEEQERREEQNRLYMERMHQFLENVQERFSEDDRARAQAKFAMDTAAIANGHDLAANIQTVTNYEVICAEKRIPLRWNRPHLPIVMHGKAFMVLNNNNPYEIYDNTECLVIDPSSLYQMNLGQRFKVIDRLERGLPESVYNEAMHSLKYAHAKTDHNNAARMQLDGDMKASEAGQMMARMARVDAKHGIVTADKTAYQSEKIAALP